MHYDDYRHLRFDQRPNGVLLLTLDRPPVNATDARMHWELTQVWRTVGEDHAVRVILVTGAGTAFSAGGDIAMLEEMSESSAAVNRSLREAADIVYNMANLDKPILSAACSTFFSVATFARVRSWRSSGSASSAPCSRSWPPAPEPGLSRCRAALPRSRSPDEWARARPSRSTGTITR